MKRNTVVVIVNERIQQHRKYYLQSLPVDDEGWLL
jgi:hypothetical protein